METRDPINARLLELVKDYGGPTKAAEALGMATPQIFYNLKNRADSKPNSETIEKIFSLLPNANANWVYKGQGPKYLTGVKQPSLIAAGDDREFTAFTEVEETETAPSDSVESRVQAAELAGLRRENKLLRETVEILRTVVSTQMSKDLSSKTESANGSTQGEQLMLDLLFKKRTQTPVKSYVMRDAFGVSGKWATQG